MPSDKLSRPEMEAIIGRGGSVLHGGRIITRVADLPRAEELAGDDPNAQAEALEALRGEQAETNRRIAALEDARAKGEPVKHAKPEPRAEARDDKKGK